MNEEEGYDVLRLIEHGKSCYISSEYVKGSPLIRWIKYHPNLSKEQLFIWMQEMARQLQCIHNCRGNPCYQYVNPYSVIITEEKKLFFLDMHAESNGATLRKVQRRSVREHFLPPGADYYQAASVELDIYGLGKTFQYLLSITEPSPALTKREEARFHKIISRCLCGQSRRTYTQMSELRRQLPAYQIPRNKIPKKRICLLLMVLVFLIAGIYIYPLINPYQTEQEPAPEGEEDKLMRELGFIYFLDKKEYEKSRDYFSQIPDVPAENMAKLSDFMKKGGSADADELDTMLHDIEAEIEEEDKYMYYRCFLEGYRTVDSRGAAQAIMRLAGYCMKKETDEEEKKELTGMLAVSAERLGEKEQAAKWYMELMEFEKDEADREELYKKMVLLYEENDETQKAEQICRQGIEELTDSVQLRIIYIRMQCATPSLEREICASTIQEYIKETPEIVEEPEFQKLVKEYDITMEGENVWVGR